MSDHQCLKCPESNPDKCQGCEASDQVEVEHGREALKERIRVLASHPILQEEAIGDEWGQHADIYFRGQLSGVLGACMRIQEAMDGKRFGTIGNEVLNNLCNHIDAMAKSLKQPVRYYESVPEPVGGKPGGPGWYFVDEAEILRGPFEDPIKAYAMCAAYIESLEWTLKVDKDQKASK